MSELLEFTASRIFKNASFDRYTASPSGSSSGKKSVDVGGRETGAPVVFWTLLGACMVNCGKTLTERMVGIGAAKARGRRRERLSPFGGADVMGSE